MTIVKQLKSGDQRTEGPGIYLLGDDKHTYGVKPECSKHQTELIPFSWATEFPPLGDFVTRFPAYWHADKRMELWEGGAYNPQGVYWNRYDPKQLGGTR